MDAIERREVGRLIVNLHYSEAESPREWEDDTCFFTFIQRYGSPDKPPHDDPESAAKIAKNRENIFLPVWAYIHGQVSYVAAEENPFNCPWDSGLAGYIYMTRKAAREALGVSRITERHVKIIKERLRAEVEAYSQWANGEVYGWTITDETGEYVDGCGGYIGDPDYALQGGISEAEAIIADS